MYAIFTFHSIDDKGSVISYSPRHFALLLEVLAEKNIPVLDLDTLLAPGTRHGVAITFDDGMHSVYRQALPVLRDYGVPAHLFLATGAVDSATPWPPDALDGHTFEMLNWDEIGALHTARVAIECHTRTHPDMRTLSNAQMQEECEQADDLIGKRNRILVTGSVSPQALDAFSQAGWVVRERIDPYRKEKEAEAAQTAPLRGM